MSVARQPSTKRQSVSEKGRGLEAHSTLSGGIHMLVIAGICSRSGLLNPQLAGNMLPVAQCYVACRALK